VLTAEHEDNGSGSSIKVLVKNLQKLTPILGSNKSSSANN
jgi:hypothetical protein